MQNLFHKQNTEHFDFFEVKIERSAALVLPLGKDWMFLFPQTSYVEILTLKVMVGGGGGFGRW